MKVFVKMISKNIYETYLEGFSENSRGTIFREISAKINLLRVSPCF